MSTPNVPRGPGLFEVPPDTPFVVEHANGKQYAFDNFRELDGMHLEGQERPPGSALIAIAAWLLGLIGAGALYVSVTAQQKYVFAARHQTAASLIEALLLDLLMLVFTLLALGLSRAGKSSRTERALILACAAASAYMNVSAADTASPRSVVAYAVAPIALAVVVDRVVAVIRRHVLADEEISAWTALGGGVMTMARLAGLVVRYSLRFAVDAPTTAKGLRQGIINAAPLPAITAAPAPSFTSCGAQCPLPYYPGGPVPCVAAGRCMRPAQELPTTKKAALLALYRVHPEYGVKASAAKVAAELAPQAELSAGTARAYLYAELEARAS